MPPIMRRLMLAPLLLLLTTLAAAQSSEQRTSHYLDSIRRQPQLLLPFLHSLYIVLGLYSDLLVSVLLS